MRWPVTILLLISVLAAYWILFRRKSTPADRLAAYQKQVAKKGGEVFQTELNGQNLAFLLMDCKVYLLDASGKRVEKTKVVQTGFYLGFKTCMGQSIKTEKGYVIVLLENRAIGAGGGNTSGGTYRSRDGKVWEKWTSKKGWLPVDEAQA